MSNKSSCPTECGPRGDIIPTLKIDEEQEAFSLEYLPHYSCFKSVINTSDDKLEPKQVENTSGEQEKEVQDTSCDIEPQKEPENASCCLSDKADVVEMREDEQVEVDEEQTDLVVVKEDGDYKQKSKESDHSSSLFNIADAKSDDQTSKLFDTDQIETPALKLLVGTPNIDMLVKGVKNQSQKSPSTKSPAKSPRELLQSMQLPPVASQQIYDDNTPA